MKVHTARRGLTLIELLVVVAVVGLLAALLLPAVQAAREAGRRASCANNLRQLGLGLQSYVALHGVFPDCVDDRAGYSLFVRLLPFVEQQSLYDAINQELPWFHAANFTGGNASLSMLLCPSEGPMSRTSTSYAGNWGDGVTPYQQGPTGLFANRPYSATGPTAVRPVGFGDLRDGSSQTAALAEWLVGDPVTYERRKAIHLPVEMQGPAVSLTPNPTPTPLFLARCRALDGMVPQLNTLIKGARWALHGPPHTLYNHAMTPNQPSCVNTIGSPAIVAWTAGSEHPGGSFFAAADGHVRFVRDTIEPDVWHALGSRSGGELISGRWD